MPRNSTCFSYHSAKRASDPAKTAESSKHTIYSWQLHTFLRCAHAPMRWPSHVSIWEPPGVYTARKLLESLVGSLGRHRGYEPLPNPSAPQVTYLNYPFRPGFEPVLLPFATEQYVLFIPLGQKSVGPCQDSRIFQTHHIFVTKSPRKNIFDIFNV